MTTADGSASKFSSLSKRLVLVFVLASSVVTLVISAVQLYWDYRREVSGVEAVIEQIRRVHSESLAQNLWALDDERMQTTLNGVLRQRYVTGLAVLEAGKVRARVGNEKGDMERTFPLMWDLNNTSTEIGALQVFIDMGPVYEAVINRGLEILLGNVIKTAVVIILMLIILHRMLSVHVNKITAYLSAMRFGPRPEPLILDRPSTKVRKPDELDVLVDALNGMSRKVSDYLNYLKSAEERFRDFAEASSDWYWEMGPDLRMTFVSERVNEIAGFGGNWVIGKARWELTNEDITSEKWRQHIADLEACRPFKNFVYTVNTTDGRLLVTSASGKPRFDAGGRFLGYRGSSTDITRRKMFENELARSLETAHRANRAKSEFLAHMSHELRTPLNSIIGFSQMMNAGIFGPLDAKYAEYIGDIESSAQHLLEVINDILDISKIEAGEFNLEDVPMDIAAPVNDAHRLLRGRAESKGIDLDVLLAPGHHRIKADPRLVRQMVVNLLSNAVKFTPQGGRIWIEVLEGSSNSLQLIVADTGIGMEEDDIPRVLSPFGQVRKNAMLAHEGTGLGLSLTKKLAELHGGALTLESQPGRGTRVAIVFPAARRLQAA
ncbi:MAG: ATP-binding protein [Rhodospirillales bacterium]